VKGLPLYDRSGLRVAWAKVDDDKYETLLQFQWALSLHNYVIHCHTRADGVKVKLLLHRFLLGVSGWKTVVDHIDGDPLNNQMSNLRACDRFQNQMNRKRAKNNTTGYKGVHHVAKTGKFSSAIDAYGTRRRLGTHMTAEAAHEAYKKAARELHGEFANFGDGCVLLEGKPCDD
jgi:hypothetical protein